MRSPFENLKDQGVGEAHIFFKHTEGFLQLLQFIDLNFKRIPGIQKAIQTCITDSGYDSEDRNSYDHLNQGKCVAMLHDRNHPRAIFVSNIGPELLACHSGNGRNP